jgi:hypothetical protein
VTTYWLPLVTTDLSLAAAGSSSSGTQTLVAKVEVFDVAIVDDVVVPLIGHSIVRSASTGGYVLSVTFPPIERSLRYDPTLNLGLLVGDASKKSSSSGGDGGTMMMIGAGVAVPVALIAVVAVMIAGVVLVRRRRTRANTQMQAMIAHADMDSGTSSPVSTSLRPHWVSRFSLAEQSNELWEGEDLRRLQPNT